MATIFTPVRLRAFALIVGVFVALFVALQFVRPTLTNPPVVADLVAPPDVKAILRTSCYNCHSDETKIPWFDKIVPAYWLVVRDVKRGRMHMNFSKFGTMSTAQQKGYLYEAVNQVQLGSMPPANYKFVHPESIVTPAQLDVLKKYLHPSDVVTTATPDAVAASDAEYQSWIGNKGTPVANVQPAPNGISFFPDYKDWKPVSTTDRFDNGTFRVILGNDVAIRAIADNNIHPWPDGSAFAKIAWKQQPDATGTISTGHFIQVEFMTKDATKYKSTEGWGFARWRGDNYKPYGSNANFTVECTSCHQPMHDNDFVYTMPIHDAPAPSDVFNPAAALPANLPYQPLQWRVITSSVDHNQGTMSTLYGNDAAVDHARTAPQTSYPVGAVLSLVTWTQQDDRHWFGGRIPGKPLSVEFASTVPSIGLGSAYTYEIYQGDPLQKVDVDDVTADSRAVKLFATRPAVMP